MLSQSSDLRYISQIIIECESRALPVSLAAEHLDVRSSWTLHVNKSCTFGKFDNFKTLLNSRTDFKSFMIG